MKCKRGADGLRRRKAACVCLFLFTILRLLCTLVVASQAGTLCMCVVEGGSVVCIVTQAQ